MAGLGTKFSRRIFVLLALLTTARVHADELIFQDDFKGGLSEGWYWVREHREAWRATDRGLEVRIEPGNMWGPANDAKNLLVRSAPDASRDQIEISVNVENQPTNQYEQVDLVWYYDDSDMVKIGRELVDGQLSVVMGREQADRTRTVKIVPIKGDSVRLKLLVQGNQIRGEFRAPDADDWREVGGCDLPAPPTNAPAKISLQFYQGTADSGHWARVSEFRVRRTEK
jgi:regulation of enolase protein 1 (concanavalin A-like superfamily)